jgi:exosortase A
MSAPESPGLPVAVRGSPVVFEDAAATAWKQSLVALLLSFAALFLVYFDTYRSMMAIWSRSDTYVHGYFVLPISLYLIWTLRAELRKLTPRADARAVALLGLAGLGWLAGRLAGVLVAEQYFAVASIPLLVWAVVGLPVVYRILFPLGYLLLLVPVGEALIPYLIEYTAAFAVTALRLTGVPVLQEGNLLTLPTSQWSVVEACSGIRYLIACITIGLLFAYLTYRSWRRRALFIALSVAVPIVANWVRAYLIVLIGHASDMKLAVGVDHLIYGWIFYAVVMCLLLWGGSLFADGHEPAETSPNATGAVSVEPTRPAPVYRTVIITCAAVLAAAIWPAWAGFAAARAGGAGNAPATSSFTFPDKVGEWPSDGTKTPWEPHYVGAGFTGMRIYGDRRSWVGIHVALYPEQAQGEELVSSANSLVGPESRWRQPRREIRVDGGPLSVEEAVLTGPDGVLLVWKWYWIAGQSTSSKIWAKALESKERLLLRSPSSAGIVLFTDGNDEQAARARLEEFLEGAFPSIHLALVTGFEHES